MILTPIGAGARAVLRSQGGGARARRGGARAAVEDHRGAGAAAGAAEQRRGGDDAARGTARGRALARGDAVMLPTYHPPSPSSPRTSALARGEPVSKGACRTMCRTLFSQALAFAIVVPRYPSRGAASYTLQLRHPTRFDFDKNLDSRLDSSWIRVRAVVSRPEREKCTGSMHHDYRFYPFQPSEFCCCAKCYNSSVALFWQKWFQGRSLFGKTSSFINRKPCTK